MQLIPEIKIDHFNWRVYNRPDGDRFIVYNLIFSVVGDEPYDKEHALSYTEEYCKSLAWTYKPDPLDILYNTEEYYRHQLNVWVDNPCKILRYIEKFDKFQAREWVEYNPVTVACCEGLEKLKLGKEDEFAKTWQGMTAHSGKFFRIIQTLDDWWD